MTYHYVWLAWPSAFLLPWLALYVTHPPLRRVMSTVSLATAVFGLTASERGGHLTRFGG